MKPIFIFRNVVGYATALPFVTLVHLMTPVWGRRKAVEKVGAWATSVAVKSLKMMMPKPKDMEDYDTFQKKLVDGLKLWAPLYDVSVAVRDRDKVMLEITNCPFCQSIQKLGVNELCPYICQGDWEFARQNADKWDFDRQYQIGTGDRICNHTYLRKSESPI